MSDHGNESARDPRHYCEDCDTEAVINGGRCPQHRQESGNQHLKSGVCNPVCDGGTTVETLTSDGDETKDMTKEYRVNVGLHSGATIEAESVDEAIEKAKKRDWGSGNLVHIVVEDPDTGTETEWGL